DDLVARFGRATLAFDHGEGARALEGYTAVVAGAARSPGAWSALLAPVAAATRARLEAVLLDPALADALPWNARLELARLAERVARRAGDADALERGGVRRGCAREVFDGGSLGALPHLDLDRADDSRLPPPPTAGSAGAPPPAEWTRVVASGCRLSFVA